MSNELNTKKIFKNKLILCDFDGTLTRYDTFPLFLFFAGGIRFYFLLPFFVFLIFLYKINFISAKKSKEYIFSSLFKGYEKERLCTLGEKFIQKIIISKHKYFRENALEFLAKNKNSTRIIIVSASPDVWVAPFAKAFNIEYISTKFAYADNKFTGCFLGENCNNCEKVYRIKEKIPDLSSYFIESYGDTIGDIPMLDLANKAYFQYFS